MRVHDAEPSSRLAKRIMDLWFDVGDTNDSNGSVRAELFEVALEIEQMQTAHDFMAKELERLRLRTARAA